MALTRGMRVSEALDGEDESTSVALLAPVQRAAGAETKHRQRSSVGGLAPARAERGATARQAASAHASSLPLSSAAPSLAAPRSAPLLPALTVVDLAGGLLTHPQLLLERSGLALEKIACLPA